MVSSLTGNEGAGRRRLEDGMLMLRCSDDTTICDCRQKIENDRWRFKKKVAAPFSLLSGE